MKTFAAILSAAAALGGASAAECSSNTYTLQSFQKVGASLITGDPTNADCTGDGQILYDAEGSMHVCTSAGPKSRSSVEEAAGATPFTAVHSCNDALAAGATDDGVYWVHAGTAYPRQVYCDMTRNGGGWAVMAKLHGETMDWITDYGLNTDLLKTAGDYTGNSAIWERGFLDAMGSGMSGIETQILSDDDGRKATPSTAIRQAWVRNPNVGWNWFYTTDSHGSIMHNGAERYWFNGNTGPIGMEGKTSYSAPYTSAFAGILATHSPCVGFNYNINNHATSWREHICVSRWGANNRGADDIANGRESQRWFYYASEAWADGFADDWAYKTVVYMRPPTLASVVSRMAVPGPLQLVGMHPSAPARSCLALMQMGARRSGAYWIKMGTGDDDVMQIWCDQETESGGWMLIGKLENTQMAGIDSGSIAHTSKMEQASASGNCMNQLNNVNIVTADRNYCSGVTLKLAYLSYHDKGATLRVVNRDDPVQRFYFKFTDSLSYMTFGNARPNGWAAEAGNCDSCHLAKGAWQDEWVPGMIRNHNNHGICIGAQGPGTWAEHICTMYANGGLWFNSHASAGANIGWNGWPAAGSTEPATLWLRSRESGSAEDTFTGGDSYGGWGGPVVSSEDPGAYNY